ncbi:hypothetical protein WJX72_005942 [[Myrmecia] bisecta]|uniref:Phospholipid-transporting ATPase n=1 Tax=[Myrmecia] bisecta TaxID=41462 RepID=A0AAW1QFG1_9CHLO
MHRLNVPPGGQQDRGQVLWADKRKAAAGSMQTISLTDEATVLRSGEHGLAVLSDEDPQADNSTAFIDVDLVDDTTTMPRIAPHPGAASTATRAPTDRDPQDDGQTAFENDKFRTVYMRLDGPVPALRKGHPFWLWLADMGVLAPAGPTGNRIRTSKYTPLTFLPVNLFQQFARVANLYFLFIAVLQLIPGLSPTSWVTTVAPLVFVLVVNAVKEMYDDYYRHKSDDGVNCRSAHVLRVEGEVATQWRHLCVGDVVKVKRDAEMPADLVFLASSDVGNLCYVETANLDGETNLKLKYCYAATQHMNSAAALQAFAVSNVVQCEKPNEKLYVFEGSVQKSNGSKDPLDVANLLLRGCTLRNTDWVIGLVTFAGFDTKIFKNRTVAKPKVTQLEKNMNLLVVGMFLLQAAISVLCSIGNDVFLRRKDPTDYYLEDTKGWPELPPGFADLVIQFFRFMILLNQMIPISLYVTLEVVKVFQCLYLAWDRAMYHAESDTPFLCRTTTLNEELGQVEYILSDKTGTLTQNVMGFVWCSIQGVLYGRNLSTEPLKPTPHLIVQDVDLQEELQEGSSKKAQRAIEFCTHLAVCNTVVPAVNEDGDTVYQASSPDEEALVQGAADLGFRLISRSVDKVQVDVQGRQLTLHILAVLEFNSDRKRMSIICGLPDGSVRLYCKGADSMIYARLAPGQQVSEATQPHLAEMARGGFRTLCIAQRDIGAEEYRTWADAYHEASVALEDREEKIAACAEKIERNLTLLGATAVEDRLQDGVPDAIATLSAAGMKVWVLTGDKLETAISIALSCRLFTQSMKLLMLRERDLNDGKGDAPSEILLVKTVEVRRLVAESLANGRRPNIGLVIEGGALAVALKAQNEDTFLDLCKLCQGVVCCRVSPMQKALVVHMVKAKAKAVTLGIGDGANDVGMIQAAHIGVGISGREGRAAVLASDFAIGQFRFVARLLLVHGRWSYKRNSEVVMYAFYKNLCYCLPNVFFAIMSGYSSQPLYTAALIASFNVIWTSLPTIGFAIFEQDVSAKTMMETPQLYMETMHNRRPQFFRTLMRWLLEGLWHALVVFAVPLFAMHKPRKDGTVDALYSYGVATYTAIVIIVNLKVALRTRYFTLPGSGRCTRLTTRYTRNWKNILSSRGKPLSRMCHSIQYTLREEAMVTVSDSLSWQRCWKPSEQQLLAAGMIRLPDGATEWVYMYYA